MSKTFKAMEGETVLLSESIHWKNYIVPLVTLVVTSALIMVIAHHAVKMPLSAIFIGEQIYGEQLGGFLAYAEFAMLAFINVWVVCRLISISYVRYYVTDRRVVATKGVFTRRTEEMFLNRCEMVDVKQSLYERLFGCGDILCTAAVSTLLLDDVNNVFEFKHTILKALSEIQK